MLPIPFARDRLLTRGASMLRASKVLLVVSAVLSVALLVGTYVMVKSDGPVVLSLPLLAMSLAGLFLAPQRMRQLRVGMQEKGAALDAMEAAGQTEVASNFVDL